jgi:hypothetical protein
MCKPLQISTTVLPTAEDGLAKRDAADVAGLVFDPAPHPKLSMMEYHT